MTPAELRAVNFADFQRALKAARPSTNEENRQKLVDFAEKYAEQT
jgi:ribosome recycling factor